MIETKQLDSLEYLVCQGIPVPHCFTTRLGGISSGLYSAANGLDQLNRAIADLQKAVSPLAKLFG